MKRFKNETFFLYNTHPTKACVCSPGQVQKYLNRISGPLLDRIDLQIEVIPVPFEKMSDARPGESSTLIRERVVRARQTQSERYAEIPGVYCNAQMNSKLLARYARPDDKRAGTAENGHEPLQPLGTRLRPHLKSFTHHRRS